MLDTLYVHTRSWIVLTKQGLVKGEARTDIISASLVVMGSSITDEEPRLVRGLGIYQDSETKLRVYVLYIHTEYITAQDRRGTWLVTERKACSIERRRRELFSCKPLNSSSCLLLPLIRYLLLRHENNIIINKQSLILQCSKPRVTSSSATAPISRSASVSLVLATSQLIMSSPSSLTPGTACPVTV